MELPIHRFQDIKTGIHIFQGVLIFVAWAMTIAILRSGNIDGRIGWEFGLAFLSIPGIIFLTMTPRFPRSQRLAHPYALLTVDAIYTILWISGFASVASWNSAGKCTDCGVSDAVVGFGVVIFLLFALTTVMSVYGVKYWRTNGVLPGASRAPYGSSSIDPDKDAFSATPHDDEYAPVQNNEHEADEHDHDGAAGDQFDTAYHSAIDPSFYGGGTGHEEYPAAGGSPRVHFPSANYDQGRTPIQI